MLYLTRSRAGMVETPENSGKQWNRPTVSHCFEYAFLPPYRYSVPSLYSQSILAERAHMKLQLHRKC